VRANNARDYLEFLERAYPALHRHLLETLPRDVLLTIQTTLRTDWIPVDLDGQYVEAIVSYLGAEGTKAACRRFLSECLVQSPMLRAMFDGAVRLFGVSVGGFLRVLPSAFAQSYKDAFVISLERTDSEGLLVFDDIAPEVLRFPAYATHWEGILLGIYDLAHTTPRLSFQLSRAERRIKARFRW
jgi:hypothetical protein